MNNVTIDLMLDSLVMNILIKSMLDQNIPFCSYRYTTILTGQV